VSAPSFNSSGEKSRDLKNTGSLQYKGAGKKRCGGNDPKLSCKFRHRQGRRGETQGVPVQSIEGARKEGIGKKAHERKEKNVQWREMAPSS